ncbi:MAG: arylsulfatase [Dinoroseobacter sp.]|nr:arylsulfatase [Dinoroseobacter sp.]
MKRILFAAIGSLALASSAFAQTDGQAQEKPNILVIWGDDVGWSNVGAYNMGMMGYRTPNIDRIAKEGMLFTDYYAQQSCTAGRAAFITGQHPFRTGLLTVGMPGASLGLQPEDPTIADLLKEQGYATGQFGKNHLGDLNKFLPTVHGFDEFFGSLYHLNAEEEPEDSQYPHDVEGFYETFGPRGNLDCKATDVDDPTEEPRWGRIGKQVCEDTGPITRKRMETMESELLERSLDFMERAHADGKPFFIWHNALRMHVWTRLSEQWEGSTRYGLYADGMQELDWVVGELLAKLEELGIADNTIVVFSSDNGAEKFTWPDGGTNPFHGEKGQTWEGGFRVPALVRWPGVVEPGRISNEIFSHEDWLPTLLAAAGDPDIVEKLKAGHTANGKDFKVHIDGYNQIELLAGNEESARQEIFYFDDNGSLNAVRVNDWKVHFSVNEHWFGGTQAFPENFPRITNLRMDPYEEVAGNMEHQMMYFRWAGDKFWIYQPMQAFVGRFLQTFEEFPQRQKSATRNVNQVLERMQSRSPTGR